MAEPRQQSRRPRGSVSAVARLLLALGTIMLLGVVLVVPFVYETQTLWYKFGADKTMLRTGQMAGLLGLVLLLLQVVLAVRPKFLVELYGGPAMVRWHRINGIIIVVAAVSHVLLVLVPEGIGNLPIGKKYWPEMVGALLFLVLLFTVVTASLRTRLKLDYRSWKTMHRSLGYLIPVLACVHVLFVSEAFEQGVPRVALGVAALATGMLIAVVKFAGRKKNSRRT